jgi:hypothetical protein
MNLLKKLFGRNLPTTGVAAQSTQASSGVTMEEQLKLVFALRRDAGIDTDIFVKDELPVMIGALKKGHKPEDIVQALSERNPRDAARKLGLF